MRHFNKQQRAYLVAKAKLEYLEGLSNDIDMQYIADHGIVNPDGTIPDRSWMIDDDAVATKAIEECSKIIEDSGLWSQILSAREVLKSSENDLIAYGLSIIPPHLSKERETLKRVASTSITHRMKLIDYTMKLDARTVPSA